MVSGLAAGARHRCRADPGAGARRIHRRRQLCLARGGRSGIHPERHHAMPSSRRKPPPGRGASSISPSPSMPVWSCCRSPARFVRSFIRRLHRPPRLTYADGTDHDDRAGRDRAGNAARQPHSARLGVRRPRALHDLPHSRGRRAGIAAGTGRARSRGAVADRRHRRRAAGLPVAADRQHLGAAAADRGCQRAAWPDARRNGRQRAPGHGRVHRPSRFHHARRSQNALRRAVHSQPVLRRDEQGAGGDRRPLFEFHRRRIDGDLWARCAVAVRAARFRPCAARARC